MYDVWIKVDETLPWIELKGSYQTKREARGAAKDLLSIIQVKIVPMPKSNMQTKTLAAIRR